MVHIITATGQAAMKPATTPVLIYSNNSALHTSFIYLFLLPVLLLQIPGILCSSASVCVLGVGGKTVLLVLLLIVKHAALPSCAVDGYSRNPLY